MEIRIITVAEKHAWQEYVNGNPHAIAWQSYDWSDVLAEHYRFDFMPLAAYDGSRIRGILPLYHMQNSKGGHRLLCVPYAVAGGILADDSAVAERLLQEAIEISKKYGDCPITLKQYKIKISGDLLTDENFYNRELRLTPHIDSLWDQLDDRNKAAICDANKKSYSLEYPANDIDAFYNLLLAFHHKSGIPCVGKKWVKSLIQSGMYSFALVKHSGKIVAGTMVKEFKDSISFPFSAIPSDNRESSQAAYWLYWNLIKQYAGKGFGIFHSGRIPKNNDTYQYRLGWGGVMHNYYYQYYPDTGCGTEYKNKRGWKQTLFKIIWKRIPVPLAGVVGPSIVKRFP